MVSIILTILKVIGIIFLVLLGIIASLALLVLFVPVRYRAGGSYAQQKADLLGRVSWLVGIICVTVRYQNDQPFHIRARLFGIPVFDNLRKRGRRQKKKRRVKEEEPQIQAASVADNAAEPNENDTVKNTADTIADTTENDSKERAAKQNENAENSEPMQQEAERAADEAEMPEQQQKKTDKTTIFQKIQKILMKFIKFFENIKFTFQRIYVIMKKIKDNIRYYLELLQQESTKQAFGLCKKQFLRILKNICPKKYSVKLHLGFEDPAVLGNALAVCGMLYPWHMGRIEICPEFEHEIVEGSFSFKGRIHIYVLLWTAWLFLTDKNIKRLRKQLNL